MTIFANRAKVTTATTGTGAITLGLAVSGYASFQEAGIEDGNEVSYTVEDGTSFEVGHGTYDADTQTLTRTVLLSKIAGEAASAAPLSLSGSAVVFLTALAEDLSEFAILGDDASFDKLGIGGAAADDTNRLSVNSPAVLFNHDGASSQVKVNKGTTGNTASFLFQNGFSGRAEIGLVGDDDFQFKVSPDGLTFYSAITLDKDDGAATFAGLGGMHPDRDPTVIDRMADRLFLGGAVGALGSFTDDQGDVIAGSSAEGANWAIRDGQMVSISPHGLIAVTGMSRNSDYPAYHSAPATIGVAGFAINDGDTSTGRAWGLYGDVQHEAGSRYSYGMERASSSRPMA